jgi:hypothetical protein
LRETLRTSTETPSLLEKRASAKCERQLEAAMKRVVLALMLLSAAAAADQHHSMRRDPSGPASPYAGQEFRDIRSLSAEDIAELSRGGGWGLAKAAELNGIPGPAHLLELKDKIPLTPGQVTRVEGIFREMRQEAIAEGRRLIAFEKALDHAFRARTITDASLREMLAEIGQSRAKLRYIHLSAHLKTLPHLTARQIARYVELRGYGNDPCGSVPEGHDPEMWRRHHGCE